MATAELIDELSKPEYVGLSNAACVAVLNEWHWTNRPCDPAACRMKLDQMMLPLIVKAAHERGAIDDRLKARFDSWYALTEGAELIDFAAEPLRINALIAELETVGVITEPEPTWLLDLGRRMWTIGRTVYQRDVTDQNVADARSPERLKIDADIKAERAAAFAEFEARNAKVNEAHAELQKVSDGGDILIAKEYVVPWKVTEAAPVVRTK